jgi:copper homeostasis protein
VFLITCEVCVEGVTNAKAAEEGGAHRVELCAGLVEGGTTPSLGTIEATVGTLSIPCVVLVRPRGGDFLYSRDEVEIILRDIRTIRELGAYGIATGALTREGDVDQTILEEIMDAAGPLSVTFHRAFDMTRDPFVAMELLAQAGVSRILTSGLEESVPQGLSMIRRLVQRGEDGISIMPGGGIRAGNVQEILMETGAREVHFTALSPQSSPMVHQNTRPQMGSDRVPGEFERLVTDAQGVRRIVKEAETLEPPTG